VHTYIIKTTLFTLCHSELFQPSEVHPQGVRQTQFSSKVKQYELLDIKFNLVSSVTYVTRLL